MPVYYIVSNQSNIITVWLVFSSGISSRGWRGWWLPAAEANLKMLPSLYALVPAGVKNEICWKFIITANLVPIWSCMTSVGTIFDVGFARKCWHLQRRFWNSKGPNKIDTFGPPMSDCQIAPACKRNSKVPVSSLSHGGKGIPNWAFFGNVFLTKKELMPSRILTFQTLKTATWF